MNLERIAELYRKGLSALDQGDTAVAHDIAHQLAELRNTGAYEIDARAHWQAGEQEEAIRLLRVGVSRFPQVAILWSFLGEYLSDLARYDEAIEAFEKSAEGHGGSRGHADLNLALVHCRAGNYTRALEMLDRIHSGPSEYRVLEMRATVLVDMGRFEEAQQVLEDLADSRPKEATAGDLALMLGLMGEAELGLGDTEQARYFATKCLELDENQIRGLNVMRRLG